MSIIYQDSLICVNRVVVGPLANNVFTLTCVQTGESAIIDAADEDELLLDIAKSTNVRNVITTHGHFDHIGAVAAMRDAGIDISIHPNDASMLPAYDLTIVDEQKLKVGKLNLEILHTPGHTPGSVCISVKDTPLIFSGDTLFPGGPGATHFPGGDFGTIMNSIETRLMKLPADSIVLPGHGAFTTIGSERPSIDAWASRGW